MKTCDTLSSSGRSTRDSLPENEEAIREGMWLPAETIEMLNQIQLMNDLRLLGQYFPAAPRDSATDPRRV